MLMKTFVTVTFSYRICYKIWGSCVLMPCILLPEWILDFKGGLFYSVNFLNLCYSVQTSSPNWKLRLYKLFWYNYRGTCNILVHNMNKEISAKTIESDILVYTCYWDQSTQSTRHLQEPLNDFTIYTPMLKVYLEAR